MPYLSIHLMIPFISWLCLSFIFSFFFIYLVFFFFCIIKYKFSYLYKRLIYWRIQYLIMCFYKFLDNLKIKLYSTNLWNNIRYFIFSFLIIVETWKSQSYLKILKLKWNIFLFRNIAFLCVQETIDVVRKSFQTIFWWIHLSVYSTKYFVQNYSGAVYFTLLLFCFFPILDLLSYIWYSVYETFFTVSALDSSSDRTHLKLLKKALYGDGPTYDQLRTADIFNSNKKYLLFWYLAAYRIFAFRIGSYTEQELEQYCLQYLDRDVMYAIVDAGIHHYTPFNDAWCPPADYLTYPVKRHPWMDFCPRIWAYRDYEPLTFFICFLGVALCVKMGTPIFMGYLEDLREWFTDDDDSSGNNANRSNNNATDVDDNNDDDVTDSDSDMGEV